jgi:hypothetical protein
MARRFSSRPERTRQAWLTGSRQASLCCGQRVASEKLGYNGMQP